MKTFKGMTRKELESNFNYRMEVWYEDGVWMVKIPALEGCMTHGHTIDEAMDMILDAKEVMVEFLIENDLDVPKSDIEG